MMVNKHKIFIIVGIFLSINYIICYINDESIEDRLPTKYENVHFFMKKQAFDYANFSIRMPTGKSYDFSLKNINYETHNIKSSTDRINEQSIIKSRRCLFEGKVLNHPESNVRLFGCGVYTGRIEVDGNIYQLEYFRENEEEHKSYKIRTVYPRHHKNFCGVCKDDIYNQYNFDSGTIRPLGYGPEDLDPYRSPNIDNTIYSVDVAVLTDTLAYFQIGGEYSVRIIEILSELFNWMNNIYRSDNLYIRPRFITVMLNVNYFHINSNVLENWRGVLLDMVRNYRRANSETFGRIGTMILHSRITFIEGIWGLAWVGTIYSDSGNSYCTDFTSDNYYNNQCFSHELGHNFNLPHDYDSPHSSYYECKFSACLMQGVSGSNQYGGCGLSTVSRYYISTAYLKRGGRMEQDVLDGYDRLLPVCGNLIVEDGEECDCGYSDKCERMGWTSICDPQTCTFVNGANKCFHGQCCDIEKNTIIHSGVTCRNSIHPECDPPEFCTGSDIHCPPDIYVMDGKPCNEGQGICMKGQCTTRNSLNSYLLDIYNEMTCSTRGKLLTTGNCILENDLKNSESQLCQLQINQNTKYYANKYHTKNNLDKKSQSLIIFVKILPILSTILFLIITGTVVILLRTRRNRK